MRRGDAGAGADAGADTDTLQRGVREYGTEGMRRGAAPAHGGGAAAWPAGGASGWAQTSRRQAADAQRHRSTCRRATSGTLAVVWRWRTAVFMWETLTPEL
ncbi:hypothetical protein GCM10010249_08130 [Streptomyces roseolilacinus]|uniref:Uncharacterized protein n=1 Tax=Streptomyces roseolilacinus TaxID=66904 RepID=A0A918AWM6_9ACTN|nr:hypothetical protein GCM10010249_08130 [Streptomyces roseolilacinus]